MQGRRAKHMAETVYKFRALCTPLLEKTRFGRCVNGVYKSRGVSTFLILKRALVLRDAFS